MATSSRPRSRLLLEEVLVNVLASDWELTDGDLSDNTDEELGADLMMEDPEDHVVEDEQDFQIRFIGDRSVILFLSSEKLKSLVFDPIC